jgi:hypothetical protein
MFGPLRFHCEQVFLYLYIYIFIYIYMVGQFNSHNGRCVGHVLTYDQVRYRPNASFVPKQQRKQCVSAVYC